MKTSLITIALLVALVCVPTVLAQSGTLPPQIEARRFYINGALLDVSETPGLPVQLDVEELDRVRLEIDVRIIQEGDSEEEETEEIELFYEKLSQWIPSYPYLSPEGPPIGADTQEWEFLPLVLTRLDAYFYRVAITFDIPEINGVSQAKLRGLVDYDVYYQVRVRIWDSDGPSEDDPVPGFSFFMAVVEDPSLRPPNPPPFADAGADVTVAAGATISLDGSRTFDSFNLGFYPLDPNVFERDNLEYVWEQVTGTPVTITYPDLVATPWLAEATLQVIGQYTFRLGVTDGYTTMPDLDTMVVNVVSSVPVNRPPHAVINGPTETVSVGDVIELDGGDSSDPDGDTLSYRWRQTDEVGGELPASEFGDLFQPLGGVEAEITTWQAQRAGTYYFMLIVDDGELIDSATTSVEVVSVGGLQVTSEQESGEDSQQSLNLIVPGTAGCGGSLLPLAMLPACLWLMRGRRR
ncbi:MAG: hypothetical protein PVJ57_07200 [Phycisphaerae bacterium]|jgi:hypothetical protein